MSDRRLQGHREAVYPEWAFDVLVPDLPEVTSAARNSEKARHQPGFISRQVSSGHAHNTSVQAYRLYADNVSDNAKPHRKPIVAKRIVVAASCRPAAQVLLPAQVSGLRNRYLMTQSGPIIDHTAWSVALTSKPRDNIAAKAGETPAPRKPSAQRIAIRPSAVMFCLVRYFLMGHPCC